MSTPSQNVLDLCDQAGRATAESLAIVMTPGTVTQDQARSVLMNAGRVIIQETREMCQRNEFPDAICTALIERTLDAFYGRLWEVAHAYRGGGTA